MDFQKICDDVVTGTDGALGCLAIDLDTGLILASARPPDPAMNDAELQSVLRYTIEMFRGRFIERFMRSMLTDRTSVAGFVREAQVATESSNLFMALTPGWESGALVLAADKSLTLGLAWMAVHQAQEGLLESGIRAPVPEGRGGLPGSASSQSADGAAEDGTGALDPAAPAAPTADPKPIPPPKEEPVAKPLPNPLMANKRRAERLKAEASNSRPGRHPKTKNQDESGRRSGLFRRRSRKKDRI